jgi:hypothetical protein
MKSNYDIYMDKVYERGKDWVVDAGKIISSNRECICLHLCMYSQFALACKITVGVESSVYILEARTMRAWIQQPAPNTNKNIDRATYLSTKHSRGK